MPIQYKIILAIWLYDILSLWWAAGKGHVKYTMFNSILSAGWCVAAIAMILTMPGGVSWQHSVLIGWWFVGIGLALYRISSGVTKQDKWGPGEAFIATLTMLLLTVLLLTG